MNQQHRSPRSDESTLPFRTANDLPAETRQPVVQLLNQSLADTTDLASQMKFAHWNVKGMNFYQLHLLFDEVAEVLEEHADTLAERATSLGGRAMGTVRMAAADSQLREISPSNVGGPEFVETTTEHLAVHAANLRAAIDVAASYGDEDTADLYTELSREVDQQLYFLESHLQADPGFAEQAGAARTAGDAHRPEWTVDGQQPASQSRPAPQRTTFGGPTQADQQSALQGQPSTAQDRQQTPSNRQQSSREQQPALPDQSP